MNTTIKFLTVLFYLITATGANTNAQDPEPQACLILKDPKSCEDLYPGQHESINGCEGIEACSLVAGEMQCDGWSVRIEQYSPLTEAGYELDQPIYGTPLEGQKGHWGTVKPGLISYAIHPCQRLCDFDFMAFKWKCNASNSYAFQYRHFDYTLTDDECDPPID